MKLTASHVFRYVNAVVLVVLSGVSIFVHMAQIYTPDKAVARCTALDTPTNCWEHGGHFRALSFVSPTTGITFSDYGVGVIYNPDGSTRLVADNPYDVLYDQAAKTTSKRKAVCATAFPDSDLVTAGDQIPEERLACLAENIPDMWEVPNEGLAHDTWNMAGGIHIWYFMWLSLWIAASFAVTMIPAYSYVEYIKFPVVTAWHFTGIVITVMAYVDDAYFQMRLPLNNVITGFTLQALAALAQFYWELEAMHDDGPHRRVTVAEVQDNDGKSGGKTMGSHLTALMTFGPENEDDSRSVASTKSHNSKSQGARSHSERRGSTRSSTSQYQTTVADGAEGPPVTHARDIFEWKTRNTELVEALNIEIALTLPAVLLAVFSMVSRVNLDWVVSSIFLRSTLFFLGMAACFKTFKFYRAAESKNLGGIFRVTVAIFAGTMVYLVAWVLFDWYHPMAQTTSNWGDAFPGGLGTIAMLTLVAMIMLVTFFLIGVVVLGVAFPDVEGVHVQSTEKFAYLVIQGLLLIIRVFVFVYTVDPKAWYGVWDPKNVQLNYP